MSRRFILMADVIKSTHMNAPRLMRDFKEIASQINRQSPEAFYSPITITLGDEFQSVVHSLKSGTDAILSFEEAIINERKDFKLRYALNFGEINTPINKQAAYGMLGPGLLETRSFLARMKDSRDRFFFHLEDPDLSGKMNMIFRLYQMVVDAWRIKDFPVIAEFLKNQDYKAVADKLKKDRSLMWKRERSLNIAAYITIKDLISKEIIPHA